VNSCSNILRSVSLLTAAGLAVSAIAEELPWPTNDLRYAVYTNFVAHTNARTTQLHARFTREPGWPTNGVPCAEWHPQSLLQGWTGFNGLSICHAFEGNPGQVRITLLTRRHGYVRGHSMGEVPGVVLTNRAGLKCWFLTTNNTLVEAEVAADLIRFPWNGSGNLPRETNDWGLLLFKKDLPLSIPSLPVISQADFLAYYPSSQSNIMFYVEQGGHCGAQSNPGIGGIFPQFSVNGWKGGDSGSPNFLPMPDHTLVLAGGRGTSFASSEMQADIDKLTRWAGLRTNDYQLRWVSPTNYLRH